MRYRAKPRIIRAVKIVSINDTEASFRDEGDDSAWLQEALSKEIGEVGAVWTLNGGIRIGTLEGTMRADEGDYLVCGTKGEIYCIKGSIFPDLYEPFEEPR